jgi:hypothetical protein
VSESAPASCGGAQTNTAACVPCCVGADGAGTVVVLADLDTERLGDPSNSVACTVRARAWVAASWGEPELPAALVTIGPVCRKPGVSRWWRAVAVTLLSCSDCWRVFTTSSPLRFLTLTMKRASDWTARQVFAQASN